MIFYELARRFFSFSEIALQNTTKMSLFLIVHFETKQTVVNEIVNFLLLKQA